jgi:hypothetical protein
MSVGSGIEGFRHDSAFARFVAGKLDTEHLKLVDVGCAGGPAPGWRAFGARLAALCIDGTGEEIACLAAVEANPLVRYHHGLVGVPDGHPLKAALAGRPFWTRFGFGRLAYERHAALRAARTGDRPAPPLGEALRQMAAEWRGYTPPPADTDYAAAFTIHPPTETGVADGPIDLAAFVEAQGFSDADFLKIDIDGPDYEVLRSATRLLQQPGLLGAAVEVSFFGSHDANDNSFHNVDRLMREKGFDLFGLSVRGYASAALPSAYLSAYPSLTLTGRPIQGDAIYLRDLSSTVHWAAAEAVSNEKLAKLAALFSLFNLEGQAAEILLVHETRLSALLDCREGLDLLAGQAQEDVAEPLSYADYIAAFEREDPAFFDVYTRRETWLANLRQAAAERDSLLARIAALEAERDALRAAGPEPWTSWLSRLRPHREPVERKAAPAAP